MSDNLIRRIAEYLARRDQVFAVGADLSEYEEIARDIAAIVAERGAGEPHFCEIHRATSGEHDCGLSPCEEATIHKDLGPPRRAKVRRVNPLPAPAPACARCGGSGEIVRYTGTGNIIFDPCPDCGGKP